MGNWKEAASDVLIGGAIGTLNQGLVDRKPDAARKITGIVAGASGLGGLALKFLGFGHRGGSFPTWKDDIGDAALTAGAVLGAQLAMRDVDNHFGITTEHADAGLLDPSQFNEAVAAEVLNQRLIEVEGGYPMTTDQLTEAMDDDPHLAMNAAGLWDDSSATDDWSSGS